MDGGDLHPHTNPQSLTPYSLGEGMGSPRGESGVFLPVPSRIVIVLVNNSRLVSDPGTRRGSRNQCLSKPGCLLPGTGEVRRVLCGSGTRHVRPPDPGVPTFLPHRLLRGPLLSPPADHPAPPPPRPTPVQTFLTTRYTHDSQGDHQSQAECLRTQCTAHSLGGRRSTTRGSQSGRHLLLRNLLDRTPDGKRETIEGQGPLGPRGSGVTSG